MLEKTNKYKVILENPWCKVGDITEDKSFGDTYSKFTLFLERLYVLSDGTLVGESEKVYVFYTHNSKCDFEIVKDLYKPLWDENGKIIHNRYQNMIIYKDEQQYLDSQRIRNDVLDNCINSQPKTIKQVYLENKDVGIIIYEQ